METSSDRDLNRSNRSVGYDRAQSDARSCLGIGVVTKNVVTSAVELAHETHAQIMLVASRRQVDLPELGYGYVERWSAASLTEYVAHIDPERVVKVCRDHGGPWQNPREILEAYSEDSAMASALASLKADVDAGFRIIHLDTSVTPNGNASPEGAIERLICLYEQVVQYAAQTGKNLEFEIGIEDQQASLTDSTEFQSSMCHILEMISMRNLPPPTYVVTQSGTKVVETENVGLVARATHRQEVQTNLETVTRLCGNLGVTLKAHNCDYLDKDSWHTLRVGGVTSANVAPQYGVTETRRFLELLDEGGFPTLRKRFIQLANDSEWWKKWMRRNSSANDLKRAMIAGHYLFSTPDVEAMRMQVADRLFGSIEKLDRHLRDVVKSVMRQHARWFGLLSDTAS